MFSNYQWKMFTSYFVSKKISVRLYQKGWQFSCHLLTCRNVKHLLLENVYLILFLYENKCKVIPKGMASHLPPNNRKKCLSIYHWKMFTSYCFNTKISVRLYLKGWHFSCFLITGRNITHLSLENVYLILF